MPIPYDPMLGGIQTRPKAETDYLTNDYNNISSDITNGTNPPTGFAKGLDPAMLGNIWESPWTLLPQIFGQNMNQAGGGYQALRDIGGDPLTLYNIMAGRNQSMADSGPGQYANWLNDLYKSYGSVGGRGFSGSELLRSIFNPGKDSALSNILSAGDSSTQMRSLYNMARDASNVGMNPMAASGYQAALARAGDKAMSSQYSDNVNSGANNLTMWELIKQIAPGLVPQ